MPNTSIDPNKTLRRVSEVQFVLNHKQTLDWVVEYAPTAPRQDLMDGTKSEDFEKKFKTWWPTTTSEFRKKLERTLCHIITALPTPGTDTSWAAKLDQWRSLPGQERFDKLKDWYNTAPFFLTVWIYGGEISKRIQFEWIFKGDPKGNQDLSQIQMDWRLFFYYDIIKALEELTDVKCLQPFDELKDVGRVNQTFREEHGKLNGPHRERHKPGGGNPDLLPFYRRREAYPLKRSISEPIGDIQSSFHALLPETPEGLTEVEAEDASHGTINTEDGNSTGSN